MQIKQAVGSLLQLLVVLLFFSVSAFLIFLEKFPHLRYQIVETLLQDPIACRKVGVVLFFTTCLIYASWRAIHQRKTVHLKMGQTKITLGNRLLKTTLSKYMDQLFPGRFSLVKIDSQDGKKIEIHLRAIPGSLPIDEKLLLKMEQEFSSFLSERLGYTGEFFLRLEKE